MNLLLLGGTKFLGRHIVNAALQREHRVTIFTRGNNVDRIHKEVESLIGDRDGNLDALKGRKWDAVIDTSGYVPRIVKAGAELLREAADHYTFISSISAYADMGNPGTDETAPVAEMDDPAAEDVAQHYGALKALCEQAVEEHFPHRALIIRPGLIVGPDDPTDRFTYWPMRAAVGGDVLAPGNPDRPVQLIDVRDLAEWTVRMAENKQTGVFNAAGPADPFTMKEMLEACKNAAGSDAEFRWVSESFLKENGVGAWIDLPLWIPQGDPEMAKVKFMLAVSIERALQAGLTFRPIAETAADTLAWAVSRPADTQMKAGINSNREQELLQTWKSVS